LIVTVALCFLIEVLADVGYDIADLLWCGECSDQLLDLALISYAKTKIFDQFLQDAVGRRDTTIRGWSEGCCETPNRQSINKFQCIAFEPNKLPTVRIKNLIAI